MFAVYTSGPYRALRAREEQECLCISPSLLQLRLQCSQITLTLQDGCRGPVLPGEESAGPGRAVRSLHPHLWDRHMLKMQHLSVQNTQIVLSQNSPSSIIQYTKSSSSNKWQVLFYYNVCHILLRTFFFSTFQTIVYLFTGASKSPEVVQFDMNMLVRITEHLLFQISIMSFLYYLQEHLK